MRSVHVTFPITAPTAAVTGPVAAGHNTSTGSTGSNGNNQVTISDQHGSTNNTVSNNSVDTSVRILYRVTFARLHHKVLKVRLSGPKGTGQLAITYLTKHAKKLNTLVRAVPANHKVKIRLHIPKRVVKLRLSVLPG
jgi:hypothetical protein